MRDQVGDIVLARSRGGVVGGQVSGTGLIPLRLHILGLDVTFSWISGRQRFGGWNLPWGMESALVVKRYRPLIKQSFRLLNSPKPGGEFPCSKDQKMLFWFLCG